VLPDLASFGSYNHFQGLCDRMQWETKTFGTEKANSTSL
jgi:hypothetical protein